MTVRSEALPGEPARPGSAELRGRRVVAPALALVVLTGCSIDSTVNPPKGMHCIRAHDATTGNGVLCDQYAPDSPTPTVTVTVTETP